MGKLADLSMNDKMILVQYGIEKYENEEELLEKLSKIQQKLKNVNISNNPKCLLILKKGQKISRNEKCFATGKKYKQCCGAL